MATNIRHLSSPDFFKRVISTGFTTSSMATKVASQSSSFTAVLARVRISHALGFSIQTYIILSSLISEGAGKSIPNAELLENTTQHLIDDIENLRKHLHMDKWHMVFGGSWGSTLALAYAEQFPTVCGSLVLRGIFCGQQSELDWIFKDGAAKSMFPEEFDDWLQFLPEQSRSNPVPAYLELLQSKDNAVSNAAGRAWNRLELSLVNLISNPDAFDKLVDEEWISCEQPT